MSHRALVPRRMTLAVICLVLFGLAMPLAQGLPKPKPKPKEPERRASRSQVTGIVKVNTEAACILAVGEETIGRLSISEVRSLELPQGTHLLKALDASGAVRFSQWIKVRAGSQDGVTVRFNDSTAAKPVELLPVMLPLGASLTQIAGGAFEAGCPPRTTDCNANELPRRRITLSRGFWMLATAVTVAQYRAFASDSGVALANEQRRFTSQSQTFVNVKWSEAAAYCSWMQGRLPTEAEWERAAQTSGSRDLGRIWEWTSDWHNRVPSASLTDPTGPAAGQNRVVRMGGSSAPRRDHLAPDARYEDVGFRCVTDRPR